MQIEIKWKIYEEAKMKLSKENLTPEEYTRKIIELCDKLEI